jgi:ubiquinone/menaquinone biosynthesis C-methylase UbiE
MVSAMDKIEFKFISFMHNTLYGLFVDPYKKLRDAGIEQGQKVLEAGFGPGFFTIPAARIIGQQGEVYAFDINKAAYESVQKKLQEERVRNVRLFLRDLAETRLENKSIDRCFFFGIFHTFDDATPILHEMHRVLKESGILSIQASRVPAERIRRVVERGGLFGLKSQHSGILRFSKL